MPPAAVSIITALFPSSLSSNKVPHQAASLASSAARQQCSIKARWARHKARNMSTPAKAPITTRQSGRRRRPPASHTLHKTDTRNTHAPNVSALATRYSNANSMDNPSRLESSLLELLRSAGPSSSRSHPFSQPSISTFLSPFSLSLSPSCLSLLFHRLVPVYCFTQFLSLFYM